MRVHLLHQRICVPISNQLQTVRLSVITDDSMHGNYNAIQSFIFQIYLDDSSLLLQRTECQMASMKCFIRIGKRVNQSRRQYSKTILIDITNRKVATFYLGQAVYFLLCFGRVQLYILQVGYTLCLVQCQALFLDMRFFNFISCGRQSSV